VKRRFIRQNREIARVNSTQSQRIRNLETEISRLVAENVSLREQAIAAQTDAERWRVQAASIGWREVSDLRERLQRKIAEMGELVIEMDRIPERVERKGRRKSRMSNIGQRISATTEAEWRNRLSLREAAIAEQAEALDGRLPAILEDKQFPRKTLENAEMAALREEAAVQQSMESPELGPPPVAHFDVPEPGGTESAGASEDDVARDDIVHLPLNLERRRKRRNSALLQGVRSDESREEPAEQTVYASSELQDLPTSKPTQQLLKTGAKRKLSISELEEPPLPASSASDDFIFHRRKDNEDNTAGATKIASRFTRPPGRASASTDAADALSSPQKEVRKVLAPKSTNSPAKRRVQVSDKPSKEHDDHPRRHEIKSTRRSIVPLSVETVPSAEPLNDKYVENELPPKTPAITNDDILSPISTEPSTRAPNAAKEAAVLNSVEDVLNGSIGRGSRRARAAVSYAEPNLRDKMRRPGKELVGAIEGLDKSKDNLASSRGASVDRVKSENSTVNKDHCRVVRMKQEPDADEGKWKQLPLGRKEEPASPLRDKERRERGTYVESENKARDDHKAAAGVEKAIESLSIFDPPVSSPHEPSDTSNTEVSSQQKPTSTSRRASSARSTSENRRHSMQPTPLASRASTSSKREHTIDTDASSTTTAAKAPLPRPSSAAALRNERVVSIAKHLKRSNSVSSVMKQKDDSAAPANINGPPPDTDTAGHASTRVERTLARRRSMMV
jgi:hypothetical protein